MACEECGRPATVHVTTISNGQRQDHHLCEACAREKGELELFTDPQQALQSWIAGLAGLTGLTGAAQGATQAPPDVVCPTCGLSFAEFVQSSLLGCPSCYASMGQALAPVIAQVQGTATYRGKLPSKVEGAVKRDQEMRRLRERLSQLVDQEEYEAAARVRDDLRALEREAQAAAPGGDGGPGAGEEGGHGAR